MKKDEFIKAVNALIDARVKKVIPELLKKELGTLKSQIRRELSEGTFTLPDEINLSDMTEILKEDSIRPHSVDIPKVPAKTYTKDAKLNAILQQTAEDIKTGKATATNDPEYLSQYKQLLAEQYQNSGDMETLSFNTSHISDIANRTPIEITPEIEKKIALEAGKRQIAAATGNAELGGLIMKDYRSFLKKVDEKAKNKTNLQV